MTGIAKNTSFFVIHSLTHLLFYVVPESLYNILFRWPICILEWMIGEEELTLAPRKERRVLTVCSRANHAVYDLYGLHQNMYYEGPMYCGHLHTILSAFQPQNDVAYNRETVMAEDDNPLCIDYLPAYPSDEKEGAKALVLILPGLTSCSQAVYVRRMATLLSQKGYYVAVLNARGVGDTPLEKPKIFSAVQTSDLRHVLRTVFDKALVQRRLQTTKVKPLVAIGFSLGGVVLSKYLGEQGVRNEPSYIDAAFAVTSPFDMNSVSFCCERSLYRSVLLNGLYAYAVRHRQVIEKLPGVDGESLFNGPHARLHRMRSLLDFDRYITAPFFGFSSPEEYYNDASCFTSLWTTKTPIMCIAARNDPICGLPSNARRWEKLADFNANVVYVEFPTGGHIGFFGNPISEWMKRPNDSEYLILQGIHNLCTKSHD